MTVTPPPTNKSVAPQTSTPTITLIATPMPTQAQLRALTPTPKQTPTPIPTWLAGKSPACVGLGSNTHANKATHDETGINASSTEIIVRLNFNTTPTKSKSCRTQAAPT